MTPYKNDINRPDLDNGGRPVDILSVGELLVDFTPTGLSPDGRTLYEANPGGAPANVSAAAARLGLRSGFVGRVGDDAFGRGLVTALSACGVATTGVRFGPEATSLAFVHLAPDGERSFSFYRNPGADTRLDLKDIDFDALCTCRVLHFGALLFTAEPARSTMTAIVEHARRNGCLISYDPNWRPALWASPETGLTETKNGLRYADIVKVSGEELTLLTGRPDIRSGIGALLETGARLVLVTLGADGLVAANARQAVALSAFDVEPVDTTGCGDAAMAGCLFKLLGLCKKPEALDERDLNELALFSDACGALCASRRGGLPAMPSLREVEEFIRIMPFQKSKSVI